MMEGQDSTQFAALILANNCTIPSFLDPKEFIKLSFSILKIGGDRPADCIA
jgi:hypothetical protein